jgi:TonB family protein
MRYFRLFGEALALLAAAAGPSLAREASTRGEPAPSRVEAAAPAAPAEPAAAPATPAATPQVEPPITAKGPEGDYLRTLHTQIHWRWETKFLDAVVAGLPSSAPLNNPALSAEVLFTIRWDGSTAEVTLSKSSGNKEFDRAAVATVRGNGHYPVPPLEVFGDDGVAHFRWAFARDYRRCSDGEVRRREAPLEEALPRLFVQGRRKEALLRAVRYMREGDSNAISVFARAYLSMRYADPAVDARAAAALVLAGDRRHVERLAPALSRPETAILAANALASVKYDLCAEEKAALEGKEADPAKLAALVLREAHVDLPDTSPCVAALSARIKDPEAPAPLRAEMLRTLAVVNAGAARRTLSLTLADPDADMRAAAASGIARPGGGRPTLYRLEPLLHDPSPEVRAAAAAGLVRATGELSFEYLRPLFKQGDVPSMLAMAPELGRRSSAGSADLLAKMLKRNDPELKKAVLDALAGRRDAPARALFQPLAQAIKSDMRAPTEARVLVYASAELDEILPYARDPVLGPVVFRAFLRARRYEDAVDWLVTAFDRLPPETLVDAFAAWLASPPPRMAATTTHG